MKKILVFNAGSSTLKYKLFKIDEQLQPILMQKGLVDQIGTPHGPKNHRVALSLLFQGFSFKTPELAKIPELVAIGHRVVHGGDGSLRPIRINSEVIRKIKKFNDLAPLHNPPIVQVIEAIFAETGRHGHRPIPNYAVFDTMFFNNLPEISRIYALPYELCEKHSIKKHGFHGLSHNHMYKQIQQMYPHAKRIITIHLGSGSSVTAIKDGQPIDTSMGFTPLEGLVMGTRPGDIDPGIIPYLLKKKIINLSEISNLLNHKSGLIGITGLSAEMKDLMYWAEIPLDEPGYKPKIILSWPVDEKIKRAKLAIEVFINRIQKYIGSYYAILGGVDAIGFSGAIGSGSENIRNLILSGLEHITKNAKIEVIDTDEELEIAQELINNINI